jgi:hypothetical protein
MTLLLPSITPRKLPLPIVEKVLSTLHNPLQITTKDHYRVSLRA